jgi:fructose-1,6-bisphosphatase/inositol monophosphatase family enzyme
VDSRLIDEVGELMRVVAGEVIMPRFGALAAGDVEEKAPGELVTIADREAEQLLSEALAQLLPGSRIVGEEQTASDPGLLNQLEHGHVWLVDPLDGTANFIAGKACFAVMVALLRDGETVGAWLLDPNSNLLSRAELGGGAYLESERLTASTLSPEAGLLRGAVLKKYMPRELRERVEARLSRIGEALPGTHCAGAEYPSIVTARQDFALFWRTLPWDHAPGALFVSEAGGVAARYDGTPYRPADPRTGLLVARSRAVWEQTKGALLED